MSAHHMAASVEQDGYIAGIKDRIAAATKRGDDLEAAASAVYRPRGMMSSASIWKSGYVRGAFRETPERVADLAQIFERQACAA